MNNNPPSIKLTVVALTLFVLASIGLYMITTLRQADYSGQIRFVTAPQGITAQFQEDKRTVNTEDTIHMRPGTYTFKLSKDGFGSDEETVFVSEYGTTNITSILEAETTAAAEELSTEVNLQVMQDIGEIEFITEEEEIGELNITSWLPFENFLFSVDYRIDPANQTGQPIVMIRTTEGYRQQAINQIRSWGYKPANLRFDFTNNYRNPFTQ